MSHLVKLLLPNILFNLLLGGSQTDYLTFLSVWSSGTDVYYTQAHIRGVRVTVGANVQLTCYDHTT